MDDTTNSWLNARAGAMELKRLFLANDGEWMTVKDAAQHLGIAEKTAASYLGGLVGQGLLERVSIYKVKGQ
jgi:DNA-binding IclR family transcriptional regulator